MKLIVRFIIGGLLGALSAYAIRAWNGDWIWMLIAFPWMLLGVYIGVFEEQPTQKNTTE